MHTWHPREAQDGLFERDVLICSRHPLLKGVIPRIVKDKEGVL